MISDTAKNNFQETVWEYYRLNGRHDLPWRQPEPEGVFDPYKIMVSEIMLQQTQVQRVTVKYQEFLALFPSTSDLADAEPGDVLRAWSGLGYNRRAKFLHQAAKVITTDYAGKFPATESGLVALPGIGSNTAGAILAYAFNQPVVFVETNVRTVYIHHFFSDQAGIDDKQILQVAGGTLDSEHPREWYWALMDYGSWLKQTTGNRNSQSKHYAKQSKFAGSKRQVRGQVLRMLVKNPLTFAELSNQIKDDRLGSVVEALLKENLIQKSGNKLSL